MFHIPNYTIKRGDGVKLLKASLPAIDEILTRIAVEQELEKALFIKITDFDSERKEASVTASYQERFHGPTNVTSDSTAQVALYNVEQEEQRRKHLWKIERAVTRLNPRQRLLINERYLTEFGTQDQYVYGEVMGITWRTYNKIRGEAFYMLAFILRVYVEKTEVK